MLPTNMWLRAAASDAAGLISTAVYVAFFILALGVVRRHRPDAWALVAGWAGGSVVLHVALPLANMLAPRAINFGNGAESLIVALSAIHFGFALLRAALYGLLGVALMRLARGAD